jgi:hypothetical protein
MNEADSLSRRADFDAQTSLTLFRDGEVPQSVNPPEQSLLSRNHGAPMASEQLDANFSSLAAHVLQLYPELREMVRLGYTKDSLYGDESEWTKGAHIVARHGCFRKNARLCISNDPMLKQKLVFELHDSRFAHHRDLKSTLAKALDGLGGVAFDKTSTTTVTHVLLADVPKSDPTRRLLWTHYMFRLEHGTNLV